MKHRYRREAVDRSCGVSLRGVPPSVARFHPFTSLTLRNSPRSESHQNELQRNRDNTSLYKVVAR